MTADPLEVEQLWLNECLGLNWQWFGSVACCRLGRGRQSVWRKGSVIGKGRKCNMRTGVDKSLRAKKMQNSITEMSCPPPSKKGGKTWKKTGQYLKWKRKEEFVFRKWQEMRCCGGVQQECESSKEQLYLVNHQPEIWTAEGGKNASRNVDVAVERLCWLRVAVGVCSRVSTDQSSEFPPNIRASVDTSYSTCKLRHLWNVIGISSGVEVKNLYLIVHKSA